MPKSCPETAIPFPTAPTLVDAILHHAADRPESRVVTFLANGEAESASLTWRELVAASRGAAALIAARAAPGERVLLAFPSGVPLITAFIGCLMARVTPATTSLPRHTAGQRRTHGIITDCTPKLLLVDPSDPGRTELGLPVLPITGHERDETFPVLPQSPADVALLQYTSGSTGEPNGVVVTNGNLTANLIMNARDRRCSPADIFVNWCPLFHDLGLIGYVASPLFNGAQLVLMPPEVVLYRPLRWLQVTSRYRGTFIAGPNFSYDLLCEHAPKTDAQRASLDLSCLRGISNAAEPIRPETVERFMQIYGPLGVKREALLCAYGLAEATLLVSSNSLNEVPVFTRFAEADAARNLFRPPADESAPSMLLPSVGQAKGGEIAVVDPNSGQRQPEGVGGEIWVRGAHVASGYWNRPAKTAAVFQARIQSESGAWLRTGDLGFFHEGRLYVRGRLKEMIIVAGQNHYPQDIEFTVITSAPGVRRRGCVAFAIPGPGTERLVIVQEMPSALVKRAAPIAETIRRAIAQDHGIAVAHLVFVQPGTLTRTTSGKLQRVSSRTRFLAGELADSTVARFDFSGKQVLPPLPNPPSGVELCRWLADWLGESTIAADASVFVHGLDSLGMVRLLNDLDLALGTPVPAEKWAANPTPARLAGLLASDAPSPPEPPQPQAQPTPAPVGRFAHLLFCLTFQGPIRGDRLLLGPRAGNHIVRAMASCGPLRRWIHPGREDDLRQCLEAAQVPPAEWEQALRLSFFVNIWHRWRRDPRVSSLSNCTIEGTLPDGPVVIAMPHTRVMGVLLEFLTHQQREYSAVGPLHPIALRRQGLDTLAAVAKRDSQATIAITFRAAVDTLHRGGVAVIASDQQLGSGGEIVPFHGRARVIRPGILALAEAGNCPVVPVFPSLNWDGSLRLEILPPLDRADMLGTYGRLLRDRWSRDLLQLDWRLLDVFLNCPLLQETRGGDIAKTRTPSTPAAAS